MEYISSVYFSTGKRSVSQDSFSLQQIVTGRGRVFMAVVCDGMGGGKLGELASGYAAEQLTVWFYEEFCRLFERRAGNRKLCGRVTGEIERINETLWRHSEKKQLRMGTTLCLLLLWNGKFLMAHAGDSRIYRLKGSRCRQLTKDHTAGENILSKCVGMKGRCLPTVRCGRVRGRTGFLLCSDGFWKQTAGKEVGRVLHCLKIGSEEEAERRLAEICSKIERGNTGDDLTAVYVVRR